ncbi:MAG: hypothetical protein MZW92_76075 [Comamonadaceae bacterium]|nr:hypothetical protein [Comamonadaceae bacterium]
MLAHGAERADVRARLGHRLLRRRAATRRCRRAATAARASWPTWWPTGRRELRPLAAQRPDLRVPVVRTGIVLARQGGALARDAAAVPPVGRRPARRWPAVDELDPPRRHRAAVPARARLAAPRRARRRGAAAGHQRAVHDRAVRARSASIENLPVPAAAMRALLRRARRRSCSAARAWSRSATRASGFRFRFETVEHALDDLLAPLRGGEFLRVWEQWLPHAAEAIWPFFCDAANLEEITPPLLRFQRARHVHAGDRRRHAASTTALRINGLPVRWQTLHRRLGPAAPLRPTRRRRGRYRLWHHTHEFLPLGGGTLMRDTVRYRLPAGWLGARRRRLEGGARRRRGSSTTAPRRSMPASAAELAERRSLPSASRVSGTKRTGERPPR